MNGYGKLVTCVLVVLAIAMAVQSAGSYLLWRQNEQRITDIATERDRVASRLRDASITACVLNSGQNYAVLAFLERRGYSELHSVRPLFPVLSRAECAAQVRRQTTS